MSRPEESCVLRFDALATPRDGTEQRERSPTALDPRSVPVHGRDTARALLFARDYAGHLKYYSITSTDEDDHADWKAFFGRDVSVVLAAAALQDVGRYRSVVRLCLGTLQDLDDAGSPDVARANLAYVFAVVGTLAARLDALKEALPEATLATREKLAETIGFEAMLANLVRTRLARTLARFMAWFRADQERPRAERLIQPVLAVPEPRERYELSILGAPPGAFALPARLSEDWGDPTATLPDAAVFGDPAGTPLERARACARHALFTGACDQFLKACARVAADAGAALRKTLESYDGHAPHYALFLAFLRMFEHARADVDALAGKHLDFYYRRVLQLAERPAEASSAHVVIELAKGTDTHLLEKGTELKAGKDALKKPVIFATDDQLVANRAAVVSVMSLHRDAADAAIDVDAAAQAKEGSWHPFEKGDAIGSFGFAVASHYLYLAEGERTITLTARVRGYAGSITSLAGALCCRLTTEEGWLEVEDVECTFADAALSMTVVLDANQPGITAFDAAVHAARYDVALPVLEFRLKAVGGMLDRFVELEPVVVEELELRVGVTGFRSLALSNDSGPIDASKPFQPFGAIPVVGSALVVGCQEAFAKKGLETAVLRFEWRNWTSPTTKASILGLAGGTWKGVGTVALDHETTELALPIGADRTLYDEVLPVFNADDDPSREFTAPYGTSATSGYVKLALEIAFGHDSYATDVAKYVLDALELPRETRPSMPPEPDTPELASIRLDYSARQSIACAAVDEREFLSRRARFYHVMPFGVAEQHAYPRSRSASPEVSLMPLVGHRDARGTRVAHAGELYVGLSGVVAPQDVALLFQVEDGSADPLTSKPSPHLHFSYLRDDDWATFDPAAVSDRTAELLASGVIAFSIPADASKESTLLPAGLTWIRVAVEERTRAVCRLVGIHAQAARATFEDRQNDPGFLAVPLAPGAISKLLTPVAAVKSVSQPYESHGGRTKESETAFQTRVSERLRHKDRAVALWDVERLVLGAFPGIHRVKCLDHTRYEPDASGGGIYDELAAGHVTVVTIPVVSASYAGDPLTPYTSLGVLEEVQDFLAERLSCFVRLHVRNPQYERLRVAFDVRLRPGNDETHCLKRLRTAITRFLSPWAFESARRPSFGGRVHRSALIDLVEEQEYVDYVAHFRLYHRVGGAAEAHAQEVVEGSRAVSVLASAASEEHAIQTIDGEAVDDVRERCGCES